MDSEPTKGPDETLPSVMGSSHWTSNKVVCLTVMEADLAVNSGLFSHIAYGGYVVILSNKEASPLAEITSCSRIRLIYYLISGAQPKLGWTDAEGKNCSGLLPSIFIVDDHSNFLTPCILHTTTLSFRRNHS